MLAANIGGIRTTYPGLLRVTTTAYVYTERYVGYWTFIIARASRRAGYARAFDREIPPRARIIRRPHIVHRCSALGEKGKAFGVHYTHD